jgi:membrane-bound metal-dependent hydrolase YbcI (DUF457 family)
MDYKISLADAIKYKALLVEILYKLDTISKGHSWITLSYLSNILYSQTKFMGWLWIYPKDPAEPAAVLASMSINLTPLLTYWIPKDNSTVLLRLGRNSRLIDLLVTTEQRTYKPIEKLHSYENYIALMLDVKELDEQLIKIKEALG